jgi:hypothetical protein
MWLDVKDLPFLKNIIERTPKDNIHKFVFVLTKGYNKGTMLIVYHSVVYYRQRRNLPEGRVENGESS